MRTIQDMDGAVYVSVDDLTRMLDGLGDDLDGTILSMGVNGMDGTTFAAGMRQQTCAIRNIINSYGQYTRAKVAD